MPADPERRARAGDDDDAALQRRAPVEVGLRRPRGVIARYRRATTDCGGGSAGTTRSSTIASSRRRARPCEPLGRERLDPLRRPQRLDLEPQVAVDVFLGGALALHLLEPVAVAQQLEVLPGREQQHEHQHDADADRLPQLALPRARPPRGRSGCCGRPS